MTRFVRSCLLTSAALVSMTGFAAAQVPDAQTGTASPGRIEQQTRSTEPTATIMPQVEVQQPRPQGAPAGAEKISFQFDTLSFDWASVYSEQDLLPLYGEQLGKTITLADLYGIADRVTRKYRDDGYILTQVVVPPQTIEGGNARLQVVEGFLDKITITGADSAATSRLVEYHAESIKRNGRALNTKYLERGLLLINDLPGVKGRAVISPSKTKAGAADMSVIIERDHYDALVSADNFGSKFLGPVQLTAAGSANSFFGMNERITAQTVLTPDFPLDDSRELAYLGLAYEQPVGHYGTKITLRADNTFTEPGYTLEPFEVEGRSQLFSLRFDHPFIRSRTMNLTGRAMIDSRFVRTNNNVEDTRRDRIRALRFGGRFEYLETFFGVGYDTADLEVARGLDIFGASDENDVNVSRPGADADFFKINGELQRLQRLTSSVNLLVAVTGQWASDDLFSSEEFGLGGVGFGYGRGYDPSEVIGDKGVAGKIEMQWNEPYEVSFLDTYQLYGFFDAGRVWNSDAVPAQKRDSVTSTGFGLKADFNTATSGGALVAFPLSRDVQTMDDRDPRFYLHFSRRF